MKVCLVIPPSMFLLDERVFVSLGLLKVASSLLSEGYEVEVLDLSGVSNYEDAMEAHARTSAAHVYGVTATTPQMPAAHKILHVIRRERPAARCVLGGPHATLVLAAQKREAKAGREARGHRALRGLTHFWDQIVAGDGELAMPLVAGGLLDKIVDADDPAGPLFLKKGTLDRYPWPARHLIDLKSYRYTIDGQPATSLIAQLGCPYQCTFCAGRYSPFLRRVRTRSTASIVSEIEHLHDAYGYTGFMFYDDELNVSTEMVQLMDALTDLQERKGVEFRLRGFVKAELFTVEQAAAMKRAGFRWLLTGFESGSPRILTNIQKQATRDDNTRCVQIARAAGLKVKALMSIGHAGESTETCQETEQWLYDMEPDDFDVTIITPYPGSPYYDDTQETSPGVWTFTSPKTGDRLHGREIDYNVTADYYKGAPDGGYTAYVFTDHLTEKALVEIRDGMERRVREKLGLPWNAANPGVRFEHSMGQGPLPPNMLRSEKPGALPKRLNVID